MVAYVQAQGSEIRRKREECGYGLRAFAGLIGIDPSHLSRIERNRANPSPDVLKRIALAIQRGGDTSKAIRQIARHPSEGSDDHPEAGSHEHPPGGGLRGP